MGFEGGGNTSKLAHSALETRRLRIACWEGWGRVTVFAYRGRVIVFRGGRTVNCPHSGIIAMTLSNSIGSHVFCDLYVVTKIKKGKMKRRAKATTAVTETTILKGPMKTTTDEIITPSLTTAKMAKTRTATTTIQNRNNNNIKNKTATTTTIQNRNNNNNNTKPHAPEWEMYLRFSLSTVTRNFLLSSVSYANTNEQSSSSKKEHLSPISAQNEQETVSVVEMFIIVDVRNGIFIRLSRERVSQHVWAGLLVLVGGKSVHFRNNPLSKYLPIDRREPFTLSLPS